MITKKTLSLIIVLTLIFMESALAAPITKDIKPKIPKKGKTTFTEAIILDLGTAYLENQEIAENNIIHLQGTLSGTLNNGDTPISGFNLQTQLSGTLNLNTYSGAYNGKWIITNNSGTFEGTITGNVEVTTISGEFNGHGKGEFEGQKIKGVFRGSVNNLQAVILIQATITSKIE